MALTAAIYARFSSDSQRDESIEIQVEHCSDLIEREGWIRGEVYADYALTGRNDERPSFKRCLADGIEGRYDVLVVYKLDRLARNVSLSQSFKSALFSAGRRIVSYREGEILDTPDGFLTSTMMETFAEYYSRNLSVMINDGIQENARNCKASGNRMFGYDVDATDHFVVNHFEARWVRRVFEDYVAGASMRELADLLNSNGVKTKRGGKWTTAAIGKMLANRAYIGEYRFAGHVRPGGMPTIVDEATFEMAAAARERGKRRRSTVNDYLLSDRLTCLECGGHMRGVSGKGKSGKKYTYYKCANPECTAKPIPSDKIEDAVMSSLRAYVGTEENIEIMVRDLVDHARSLPDSTEELKAELKDAIARRDNLVNSIAEGIPASSVRTALEAVEVLIASLEEGLVREEVRKHHMLEEDKVRAFAKDAIAASKPGTKNAERLFKTYCAQVYAWPHVAISKYDFGDAEELSLEELRELAETCSPDGNSPTPKSNEPPETLRSTRGSYGIIWWR